MRDYHIEYVVTQLRVVDVKARHEYHALEQLNRIHEQHKTEMSLVTENIIIVKVEEMEPEELK